ncbi:hypothetical protein NSP_110 [Nodularia spumigena CCY9414]|nr:hypothetical protein NSP_110 [Nodularia spumigena CCY9414]
MLHRIFAQSATTIVVSPKWWGKMHKSRINIVQTHKSA